MAMQLSHLEQGARRQLSPRCPAGSGVAHDGRYMRRTVIRDAGPQDAEALVDLIDQLNRHEGTLCEDRRTGRDGGARMPRLVTGRIARDGGAVLVCESSGRVSGLVAIAYAEDGPYVVTSLRRHALVTDLVVDQSARGVGIGRALLAEAEARARKAGQGRIMITALQANEAGLRAYQARRLRAYCSCCKSRSAESGALPSPVMAGGKRQSGRISRTITISPIFRR